jgi:hypothetical protein
MVGVADAVVQGHARMHSDWSDIRERVSRLAAHPDAGRVFGTERHGWRLEPTLSVAELSALETQLRVELPGEYRSFLLEAGRAGAGPWFGLLPLYRDGGRWRWADGGRTDLESLDHPFPHVTAFNPVDQLPAPPERDGYESEEAYAQAQNAYVTMWDEESERAEHSVGLLYLCHYGCGHYEVLVVSGPARGQMWFDGRVADEGFTPLTDTDGTPIDFARWYRRWLDEAESQVLGGARA